MGRIKSKQIKRTAIQLNEKLEFSKDFNEVKKLLVGTTQSKKTRNKIAGYISRLVKRNPKKNSI